MESIPFNIPYTAKLAEAFLKQAVNSNKFSGNSDFIKLCSKFFETEYNAYNFLTPSCTSALEMAALLVNLQPGDEVILPSYTFSSTANAFLLRGAKLVFVDVEANTLNIDINDTKESITQNTKIICPVHYAGAPCKINEILEITSSKDIYIIEDAAQAIGTKHNNKYLGTFGHLGALSFHETKNIHCGEGGALLVNDENLLEKATIISNKGTNKHLFSEGLVEKYTWVELGSSYSISELSAAYLYSQLKEMNSIIDTRRQIFSFYWNQLYEQAQKKGIKIPPKNYITSSNAHIFFLIFASEEESKNYITYMKNKNINVYFHYSPLHNSPMGRRLIHSYKLRVTENIAKKIVRLPIYPQLSQKQMIRVVDETLNYLNKI